MPSPLLNRLLVLGMSMVLLTGCLLQSARQEAVTDQPNGGAYHHITFYSSDTLDSGVIQEIDVGPQAISLIVTLSANVGSGELRVELLQGNDDTIALEVKSTGKMATASGRIRTNDVGNLRYRVWAANARNGEYTIAFEPPPTPTPTLQPTPTLEPYPYPVEATPTP